jgi:hypothetical protein
VPPGTANADPTTEPSPGNVIQGASAGTKPNGGRESPRRFRYKVRQGRRLEVCEACRPSAAPSQIRFPTGRPKFPNLDPRSLRNLAPAVLVSEPGKGPP